MAEKPVKLYAKSVQPHKARLNAQFEIRNVLTNDPFVFVDLWLRRNHQEEALFFWRQSNAFYKSSESLPLEAKPLLLKHRPWWANDGYAQSTAWLGAGWKTANVDMSNERVTFVYTGDQPDREIPPDRDVAKALSIAEAKAGLAANFGVPVDAVEITIRG